MQNRIMLLLMLVTVLMLPSPGCTPDHNPDVAFSTKPDSTQSGAAAQRFQQSQPHGPSAVESAVQLSEKYAKLSEEAAALKQQKELLDAENARLKEQFNSASTELAQTKKELTEANDLLVEMRVELNNWKNNILGFRDEMRDADKAQLEALLKILKTLGGEIKSETLQSNNVESNAVSDKTLTSGETK